MEIYKSREDAIVPTRGTKGSAGLDFYIPENYFAGGEHYVIPHDGIAIDTGIHVKLPKGKCMWMTNKSGVAVKKNLIATNSDGLMSGACIVDEDYQGSVWMHVLNVGDEVAVLRGGEPLMQGVLLDWFNVDVVETGSLEELYADGATERAGGKMGSTTKSKTT